MNQSAIIGATPTRRGVYGTGGARGKFLAAVALKNDMRLMPTVAPTEGNFDGIVLRFGALDNLRHSLVPSYSLPVGHPLLLLHSIPFPESSIRQQKYSGQARKSVV